VLARFDRDFFDAHFDVFDALRKDVCNMDATSETNYPFARHKDFFDGHSWASGLFQQANGKSQESSSEVRMRIRMSMRTGTATLHLLLSSFLFRLYLFLVIL
jgi:endoglucanase Acf2